MNDYDWQALDRTYEMNPPDVPPVVDDSDEIAALADEYPFETCLTAAEHEKVLAEAVAVAEAWERTRAARVAARVAATMEAILR